ncbi:hypothetical protein [Flavobacterium tyrosinilyticum]|uniref:hypothetical protein n=1 Tax=Flavobacterium tyrosinilyticum TaxID=1658740 RepID=UPI00202FF094|nr:hypothetical protein [Flavobacterium tyrosinilyticum]MCM0667560.1 hypothetical protein [Flavobacterium tyrosinilyticum]
MKLKLHFLFLFTVLGLHAQKQIQPYNFSVSDKDKTETIMIYAAASSVNNLTFTLKNAKDEVLINNDGKEISFQVFPFTEVSFGTHLTDAINSIKPKENDVENTYEIIKKRIKNLSDTPISQEQKIAVQDVRNIYQFFNALVITAFAYDTEPVAGVLKYSLNTTITKKNIEGFDADVYFTKRAKDLRDIIFNKEKEEEKEKENKEKENKEKDNKEKESKEKEEEKEKENKEKESIGKGDEFMKFVYDFDKYELFSDFYKNTKGSGTYRARVKFKHYAEKKLKELYNVYQIQGYCKDDFLMYYISCKEEILSLEEVNKNKKTLIDADIKKIEKIETKARKMDSISKFYNDFSLKIPASILEDSKKAKNEKDNLNVEINESNVIIKTNEVEIKNIQNDIDDFISERRLKIKKIPLWNFDVETIEIDINDGFIEHITAVGRVKLPFIDENLIRSFNDNNTKYNDIKKMLENFYNERIVKEIFNNIIGKELKFENEFPIGFSSKSDFADLHKYTLYAFEGSEKIFSLPVTNVITLYVQRHQNDRLDFSPKDQVVSLPSDDFAKSNAVELKKETSSKILNVNIYSDFLGLKKANPNGLLQFEVEKNIPLWTKRMELGIGRSSNFGLANYINFNLTWAKIGDEDRQLQVKYADRYVNNEYRPDRYVTFLDMIKYENTSVGADLNIASFDFPLLKARIELNAGIHYGRVNVVDTLATDVTKRFDKNVNMIRAYPDFILRIRPEERFGAYLRFRPFKAIVPNNEEFYTVSSEKDFVDEQKLTSKWLHRFELGTYYAPSPKGDNKFFFRYRYTNTSDWGTNGYGEFQVGYLVYLKF